MQNDALAYRDATHFLTVFAFSLIDDRSTPTVASIAWQLVASAFSIVFLSTPSTYILPRICLRLETTRICTGAWVMDSMVPGCWPLSTDRLVGSNVTVCTLVPKNMVISQRTSPRLVTWVVVPSPITARIQGSLCYPHPTSHADP